MANGIENKVAFVTGAARGQGRSHAVRLAEAGADIVAVDICSPVETVGYPMPVPEDLEDTASQVRKHGRKALTRIVDVRDQGAVKSAVDDGLSEFGQLDIVIANAGILAITVDEPVGVVERKRMWQTTVDVNLTGTWNTIEAVAPAMVKAGNGGSIVLTSSTQGLKYAANNDLSLTSYTVTKHGIVGLMRSTAADLAPYGIRVNSIHPTGVDTPMITNDVMASYGEKNPQLGELMGNLLPVSAVESDDVSQGVLYLVSDAGRYVTGISLPVDAGHLLK